MRQSNCGREIKVNRKRLQYDSIVKESNLNLHMILECAENTVSRQLVSQVSLVTFWKDFSFPCIWTIFSASWIYVDRGILSYGMF